MDTGKAFRQNDAYIQEAWFHGSMLTAGTFTIILFGNDNGRDTFGLIQLRSA